MKIPLKYKNQVVGYLDYMVYEYDVIQEATFYLFDTDYYNEIINNISKSFSATFDKNFKEYKDVKNFYDFEINGDLLIIKKK